MGSKFRGFLKNNKTKPEESAVSNEEIDVLLESLNDAPTEVVPEVTSLPSVNVVPTKLHTANNVFFDEKKRKYVLVTIKYNLGTGYCAIDSVTDFADSQPTALFKLNNINTMKIVKGEERG